MDASNAKSVELLKKQADWYSAMGDPKSAWYDLVLYAQCILHKYIICGTSYEH